MVLYYFDVFKNSVYIEKIVVLEESCFNEILNDGLNLLNNLIVEIKQIGYDILVGKDVFKLYDIYGFLFELIKEYVGDEDLDVDEVGFEVEMKV